MSRRWSAFGLTSCGTSCSTFCGRAARGAALVGPAAVALALACARTGPPAIPDTPAGRAFRAWLGAYNAADSARLQAYARRYEPALSVRTQLALRAQTGPWDLVSVERNGPHHLEVVLRSRADSTVDLVPLTMYGAVDVTAAAAPRASSALVLVDKGAPAVGSAARPLLRRIDTPARAAAVDSVATKVARNYVDSAAARRVADALRTRYARGVYDGDATEVAFAAHLDRDLRALSGDPQLGVEYAWQIPLPPPTPAPPAWVHCGVEGPRALTSAPARSVAYVGLSSFGSFNPVCGHDVSAAMNAVANARALVVDLRENADESGDGMAYLASYLVAGCTRLGDQHDRRTGRTEAFSTHDGLPGPAFGGTKPLVLLTSARTAAAAEALASRFQRLGRATVVGERTAGQARATAVGPVGSHLLVRVPVAQLTDPDAGASWQRAGVRSDVPVPADDALVAAVRLLAAGDGTAGRILPPAPARRPTGRPRAGGAVVPDGASRGVLRGVRFGIDTVGAAGQWRSPLTRVIGAVEFAAGRGRLDVTAVRDAPAAAVNGIPVAAPLARPGDYYLFDNTGFVLVRPVTRTFSQVAAFTRADYNQTGALLPGAFMFGGPVLRAASVPAVTEPEARRQHAPVAVHWHMQPGTDLAHLYARGWLEVADLPAAEAGVARWFEVAAALATRPGGVGTLPPDGVEVTSVVLVHALGDSAGASPPSGGRRAGRPPERGFLEMLTPRHVEAAAVDPRRLVLPAGYRAVPWPGFARRRGPPAADATGARWHTLEDEVSQRERATCGQAWLPDPRE